jgi:hypothetical protein
MWAYASSLPPKEYREWIEDGSTCTEVTLGLGPPAVDRIIKSPAPWVSHCYVTISLVCTIIHILLFKVLASVWGLYLLFVQRVPSLLLHFVLSLVAVLFCLLVDLLEARITMPPGLHFVLFGAGRKFNRTDWNPTPVSSFMCVCFVRSRCRNTHL